MGDATHQENMMGLKKQEETEMLQISRKIVAKLYSLGTWCVLAAGSDKYRNPLD